MVEDSFTYAEADVETRLLIEARNEADTVLTHVGRALRQGAKPGRRRRARRHRGRWWRRCARRGRAPIADAIRERTTELNHATERMAEAMMDAALKGALGTRRADEVMERGRVPGRRVVMAVHKVTFLPLDRTVEVDDEKYPLADHGKPGSLLDIALANDIHLEHNCGGSCACTTCHVVVKEGADNLSEMEADEEDRLDMAEGLDDPLASRLPGHRARRRRGGDPQVRVRS